MALQECLNQEGSLRSLREPRLQHPRGTGGCAQSAPAPPPRRRHTHPRLLGGSLERTPHPTLLAPEVGDRARAEGLAAALGLRAERAAKDASPSGSPSTRQTHHPRRDPRGNGNNEKPPPRLPSPESGWERRRHLPSHPREHTHPRPRGRRQPPAARPSRRASRPAAPAPFAAASPTHRRLSRTRTPLAAAGARLKEKPPRPPAPPHNMASSASAMELGKYNRGRSIFMRDRGEADSASAAGRAGRSERASEGAEARAGDVHGAGSPRREGRGRRRAPAGRPHRRPPRAGRPAPGALRRPTRPPATPG